MTKESLCFREYIENYENDNVYIFKDVFGNRLQNMSNTSSSKKLMGELDITNNGEFIIFRTTFLDFFKLRLHR
jgi:hypothetical protein